MSKQPSDDRAGGSPRLPETYGDLKRLLAKEPRGDWPSRVNPGMTHSQALDVLAAGLATHPDEQRLEATRRGELYRRNVERECRSRAYDG